MVGLPSSRERNRHKPQCCGPPLCHSKHHLVGVQVKPSWALGILQKTSEVTHGIAPVVGERFKEQPFLLVLLLSVPQVPIKYTLAIDACLRGLLWILQWQGMAPEWVQQVPANDAIESAYSHLLIADWVSETALPVFGLVGAISGLGATGRPSYSFRNMCTICIFSLPL